MGQQFSNEDGEQNEMGVAELQEWYKKFVVECPSGTLYMHEFKRFFGVENNQEAAEYVENMFKAFDKNGDNTIDFLEYVAALNLVLRGKLEHKLRWTFKMYDKDGNGCIDKPELLEIVEVSCSDTLTGVTNLATLVGFVIGILLLQVQEMMKAESEWGIGIATENEETESIYRLKQVCQPEEERGSPRLTPEEVVERIFQLVDENGDGQLSLDEFIDGAKKDKWVMKMLQMDVNPGNWIVEQRRKSVSSNSCPCD